MRTIEAIRMENFTTLMKELGDNVTDAVVSESFGISKVYAWQLRSGARTSIDSKAARKIEGMMDKPPGWLDTDFRLWPFPDIDPSRFFDLKQNQKIEIQGLARSWIEKFEELNSESKSLKNGKAG